MVREGRWFAILGLALATINLYSKFEHIISTQYEDMKGDAKRGNRLVWVS